MDRKMMDANFFKSFINIFASDFLENDKEVDFINNVHENIDSKSIYKKVKQLLKNKVDVSESQLQKLFDIEFSKIQELIKEAQSQQLQNVCQLIPSIVDMIIAKRILVSLNKIYIQKEHSKLVYRMH